MGNFVTDAMRAKYADDGVQIALTNSGGLRQDLFRATISGGEQVGEITWGEAFAVLPFGNRTVIMTLTYAQLVAAFENGLRPPCGDASGGTGRTPQFSGLKVTYHCNGNVPVIDRIDKGATQMGPGDTVRVVSNDFMFTGGDGYTALTGGTNVLQPGDALLDVMIEYIRANSPVSAAIEGRRVGP